MKAIFHIGILLLANLRSLYALPASDDVCSSSNPCKQGCCSKYGNCGFGPDFCDPDVCISTCDAKAECGKYAPKGQEHCPLNVCCSQWGFCGTSEPFCGEGCQDGCEDIKRPSCSGASSNQRYIGYFESWNYYEHPCDNLHPSDINTKPWTHLNYAFAQIDPKDSTLRTMNYLDKEFYRAFVALKLKKPSLQCFLAIGGWDAGGKDFSKMADSADSRKAFIQSTIEIMDEYGFDGIDIDWEYPVADDRGGSKSDYKNYVQLLKELKEAFGGKYGLTIAIPASYWYLRGFDIQNMVKYVDWFNIMSYDIHGVWDGQNRWTKEVVNPHTNLTEISSGLDLLWRNSIPSEKVLLGLGFYGRSFTLKDASCTTPDCPFKRSGGKDSGGALPGDCTANSGTLSNYEINRILENKSPEVKYDEVAGVNWITWDMDQWVSYDNAKTLKQKTDFANSLCLGGTFAWAIDLGGPGTLGHPDQLDDNVGLDGADLNGMDGGSGDVYVSPEIFKDEDPIVGCVPPCTFIMPPITLDSLTTISFPPYTTSLEVVWPTTSVITLPEGSVSTSTGLAKTIQSTVLTVPPVTTSAIDVWNWKVTESDATNTKYTITRSILPPPFVITNNPPQMTGGGQPHKTQNGNNPDPTPGDDSNRPPDGDNPSPTRGNDPNRPPDSNNPDPTHGNGSNGPPNDNSPNPTNGNDPDPNRPTDPNDPNPTRGNHPDPSRPNDPNDPSPTRENQPDPNRPTDPNEPEPTRKDHPDPSRPNDPNDPNPTRGNQPDPSRPNDPNDPSPTRENQPDPNRPTDPNESDPTRKDHPDPSRPIDPNDPNPTRGNDPDPNWPTDTNSPNPTPGGSLEATRTITPPPYPHSIETDGSDVTSGISFTVGPPSPTCTANCGKKCEGPFCDGPCEHDCGGEDFIDPNDKNPPKRPPRKCTGSDCENGKCTGLFCISFGCFGLDCIDGICLGPLCTITSCGPLNCLDNCIGDCGSGGGCLTSNCITFGCSGADCGSDGQCKGPNCTPNTCEGKDCESGFCTGSDCEQSDCDDPQSAARCTEIVSEIDLKMTGTEYSTTTRTQCSTVTACSAEPTTVTTTSTIDKDSIRTHSEAFPSAPSRALSYYISVGEDIRNERMDRNKERFWVYPDLPRHSKTTTAEPKPTESPKPGKDKLECYDKGSIVPRDDMMKAVGKFCRNSKGVVLDDSDPDAHHIAVQTYGGHCLPSFDCIVGIDVSVRAINGCKIELDGEHDANSLCGGTFRKAVDKCDQTSTEFKQGGTVKNNCAVWKIDPVLKWTKPKLLIASPPHNSNISAAADNSTIISDEATLPPVPDENVIEVTDPQDRSSGFLV